MSILRGRNGAASGRRGLLKGLLGVVVAPWSAIKSLAKPAPAEPAQAITKRTVTEVQFESPAKHRYVMRWKWGGESPDTWHLFAFDPTAANLRVLFNLSSVNPTQVQWSPAATAAYHHFCQWLVTNDMWAWYYVSTDSEVSQPFQANIRNNPRWYFAATSRHVLPFTRRSG